ncbi:MAG TPA: hypothetical protein PKW42_04850, partial [bacterium]|nr:hypothetical protein [bacterium]
MFWRVKFTLYLFLLLLSPSGAADHLVIISPHWEGIRVEITRKFQEWYQTNYRTAVTLEWIDQG